MKPKPWWLRLSLAPPLLSAVLAAAAPDARPGPKLRLSSRQPSATELAVVEISLESPAGKEPTALQWEMTVDGSGPAFVHSLSPGKEIRCAPQRTTMKPQTSICMLVGGVEPIPSGRVARIQLTGPTEKSSNSVRVRLEGVIGVYTDLRRISLKPVELTAPIQQ